MMNAKNVGIILPAQVDVEIFDARRINSMEKRVVKYNQMLLGMDDINMISFVELLRREFSDCQIILSTHEEDFSNFIRYKFKKYDLIAQAITLKDA